MIVRYTVELLQRLRHFHSAANVVALIFAAKKCEKHPSCGQTHAPKIVIQVSKIYAMPKLQHQQREISDNSRSRYQHPNIATIINWENLFVPKVLAAES